MKRERLEDTESEIQKAKEKLLKDRNNVPLGEDSHTIKNSYLFFVVVKYYFI